MKIGDIVKYRGNDHRILKGKTCLIRQAVYPDSTGDFDNGGVLYGEGQEIPEGSIVDIAPFIEEDGGRYSFATSDARLEDLEPTN